MQSRFLSKSHNVLKDLRVLENVPICRLEAKIEFETKHETDINFGLMLYHSGFENHPQSEYEVGYDVVSRSIGGRACTSKMTSPWRGIRELKEVATLSHAFQAPFYGVCGYIIYIYIYI